MNKEEQDLRESLEGGEWQSVDELEEAKAEAQRYAEATLQKNARMNIRMTERDLRNLKSRAAEEGVQYQTLVTMVLHKYVTGRLVEQDREPSRSGDKST
jgi:predicted DNA binding CopG/RHH family protein